MRDIPALNALSMVLVNTIKKRFWDYLYPIFPYIRGGLLFLHEKQRQPFFLGHLSTGKTLPELKSHLIRQGFGNHFVAWEDRGQILSCRKLISFSQQYHLRVFNDGEIRGHFELTPEAAPIRHFLEIGEKDSTPEFISFLGEFLTKERHIARLVPDTTVLMPDSKMTLEFVRQ